MCVLGGHGVVCGVCEYMHGGLVYIECGVRGVCGMCWVSYRVVCEVG